MMAFFEMLFDSTPEWAEKGVGVRLMDGLDTTNKRIASYIVKRKRNGGKGWVEPREPVTCKGCDMELTEADLAEGDCPTCGEDTSEPFDEVEDA